MEKLVRIGINVKCMIELVNLAAAVKPASKKPAVLGGVHTTAHAAKTDKVDAFERFRVKRGHFDTSSRLRLAMILSSMAAACDNSMRESALASYFIP